jgi:hypothetical protein
MQTQSSPLSPEQMNKCIYSAQLNICQIHTKLAFTVEEYKCITNKMNWKQLLSVMTETM